MKGYKAFNQDLTCRDYQFTIDETHTFYGEPILCKQGFHYCTTLEDIVNYYHQPDMRVFEIEASGIITNAKSDCSKRACSEIRLVKEISLNDVMLSITKSKLAYRWAYYIGNRDIMIDKINDSEYAYYWARYIGNQDIMIDLISESINAFEWAYYIGNKDIMKSRVTEPEWIETRSYWFPNDQII